MPLQQQRKVIIITAKNEIQLCTRLNIIKFAPAAERELLH